MMYVPYPALSANDKLATLNTLEVNSCCEDLSLDRHLTHLAINSVILERWGSRTLLRTTLSSAEVLIIDVASGAELLTLPRDELIEVGLAIGQKLGYSNSRYVNDIQTDQWTVQGKFNKYRPLLLFESEDSTQWYISSITGELVQRTNRNQRFWSWLGPVVHWLYPTLLRQNTALWAQVVIWLTMVALFLTLTGIAFGVKQYRFSAAKRNTPYVGWSKWHHYTGLIFGIFTLTWLLSGLVSMNPWGALESRSFEQERVRLLGDSASLATTVQKMKNYLHHTPGSSVRIVAQRTTSGVTLNAYDQQNNIHSMGDSTIKLNSVELARIARPDIPIADVGTLASTGDAYYYSHHNAKHFPVVRAIYVDGEHFYFHPITGELLLAVDENRAWYRWLFTAIHTGDFHNLVRQRPFWDVWMTFLLGGLIIGAGSGVVLAWKRLTLKR